MICEDFNRLRISFKEMAPYAEAFNNGKELYIMCFIL
jgi:hypothetical protein